MTLKKSLCDCTIWRTFISNLPNLINNPRTIIFVKLPKYYTLCSAPWFCTNSLHMFWHEYFMPKCLFSALFIIWLGMQQFKLVTMSETQYDWRKIWCFHLNLIASTDGGEVYSRNKLLWHDHRNFREIDNWEIGFLLMVHKKVTKPKSRNHFLWNCLTILWISTSY